MPNKETNKTAVISGVLPYIDHGDGTGGHSYSLLQLTDDKILPTYNKGMVAAIRALSYGSDANNVFTWDEADYFILAPVVHRYPNSFKKGGNLQNSSAVISLLASVGVVRRVHNATPHETMDVDEGLIILSGIINWMAAPVYGHGKDNETYYPKRYVIPQWITEWDTNDNPGLPRRIAPYLHELKLNIWRTRNKTNALLPMTIG